MRNFQQNKGWRNIVQSKPVLILLSILLLFFAYSVFGFWTKMRETAKNKEILEAKIASLKEQKIKLTADINNINTDEGKEKIFRENFGLAKEGEGEIVIVEDKNPPVVAKPTPTGFWGFIKNIFK